MLRGVPNFSMTTQQHQLIELFLTNFFSQQLSLSPTFHNLLTHTPRPHPSFVLTLTSTLLTSSSIALLSITFPGIKHPAQLNSEPWPALLQASYLLSSSLPLFSSYLPLWIRPMPILSSTHRHKMCGISSLHSKTSCCQWGRSQASCCTLGLRRSYVTSRITLLYSFL